MYVRLGFAIAAHLEPEILVVDEVLAVGDAEFQKKCLGKMDDISHREGRTILFVSHNMGTVTSLCSRAVWLDHGLIRRDGSTRAVIDDYFDRGALNRDTTIEMGRIARPPYVHDERLRVESLQWLSNLPLRHGEPAKARIRFKVRAFAPGVSIGIGFCAPESARLLTYYTDFQDGFRPDLSAVGEYSVDVEIDSLPLAPDIYEIEIGSRSGDFHILDYLPACFRLEVVAGADTPGYIIARNSGARLPSHWSWDFARDPGMDPTDPRAGTSASLKTAIS
jgi:lipopolysaccharide transport system ATP-binding protein